MAAVAQKAVVSGLSAQLSARRVQVARPRVAAVRAAASAEAERKLSPLERGGTLSGDKALGKDAAASTKAATAATGANYLSIQNGRFVDDRWIDGTWDFAQFKDASGEVDYDKVIDAEMARRKMLEETPIASLNDDPVNFDTGMIPWWAWVKRFHLPAAEQANGRAAMIGYVMALVVDSLSGAGIVDQQNSLLGKIALHVVVFGCLFVRRSQDFDGLKGLIDEATFYDKQWNQTWEGVERPSETEQ